MSPADFDAAMARLCAIARELGLDRIDVTARPDGRVDFSGEVGSSLRWTLRTETPPAFGSALPLPSAVLERKAVP